MADRKITDLTALAAGSQATGDLLTIVDVSEVAATDKNKKITVENLFKGIPGDVGIGTTSPAHKLDVNGQIQAKSQFYLTDSSSNDILRITEIAARDARLDAYNGTDFNGTIRFGAQTLVAETGTGGSVSERLRIDSSGNVGIGETAPLGKLHVKSGDSGASSVGASADEFVIEGSGNAGMTILSGTSNQALINFADSGDVNTGNITYDHSSNFLSIKTNDSERMRIDSSGRLMVGTSSAFNSDTQALFQVSSDGNTSIDLNRSDATISDGNPLGQINFFADDTSNAADLCAQIEAEADGTHANNDRPTRLVFSTTADDASSPTERLRITSDGTIRLASGCPGIDFSQIQTNASGMSSETLDSYEEGTFTPVFRGQTTAGTYTYSSQLGYYTKIGDTVYAVISLGNITTSSAGSGIMEISGLPFASKNVSALFHIGAIKLDSFTLDSGTNYVIARVGNNSSVVVARQIRSGGNDTSVQVDDKGSDSADIYISINYLA